MQNLTEKFISDFPNCCILQITPEVAQRMLDSSIGNRNIRPANLRMLTGAMMRGEWRITSQGIGFDKNGCLRDGHHRLTACVKSGVSIEVVAVFGMELDAYSKIDRGALRNYADILSKSTSFAAVCRLACDIALSESKPSVEQMQPYLNSGLGELAEEINCLHKAKVKYFAAAAMRLAAIVSIMEKGNKEFVFEQYRALCAQDYTSMTIASQSLSRQVFSGKVDSTDKSDVMARALRCFDIEKQNLNIQVSQTDVQTARAYIRYVLNKHAIEA